jgi:crotonobetainyl-CoA:carnitine CoA-transferase CaiB-like acyl-CoA transferase
LLPLDGIRVLEFAWTLPGPYCGLLLAELGADVIKVEPPGFGDSLRQFMPGMFSVFNRGKRSLTLDLKREGASEVVSRLVSLADVVVEGFRPGVAERLGIDASKVRSLNDRLVYCSISGYGQSGPFRDLPGHDANYAAVAGLLGASAREAPVPVMPPVPIGDLASGALAAVSVLAALLARSRNNMGESIDVAITDVLLSWAVSKGAEYVTSGELPKASEQQPPTHGIYPTRDGSYLALGAIEDHFWHRLCEVVGREDWLRREDLSTNRGRAESFQEIAAALTATLLQDDCETWVERFAVADIPATRVLSVTEALAHENFRVRGLIAPARMDGGWEIRYPAIMGGNPERVTGGEAPKLGGHTDEVLREAGCSTEELARWRTVGILG